MRKLIFAALAATTLATPAFAQDEAAPFTGLRAEGVVGYDRVGNGDDDASDAVTYGGAIGYDFQAGGAVIGVEAELTDSSNENRVDNLLVAGDRLSVGLGRDIYVGGRLGFAVTPTTLLYAKGGYTNARIETTYQTPTSTTSIGEDMEGYRLGAGAEVQLSSNVYLKGEYRYSNYKEIDGFDIDLDRHQVVAGLGFRF